MTLILKDMSQIIVKACVEIDELVYKISDKIL